MGLGKWWSSEAVPAVQKVFNKGDGGSGPINPDSGEAERVSSPDISESLPPKTGQAAPAPLPVPGTGSDEKIEAGRAKGRHRAEQLYGMDDKAISGGVQDVVKKRRERLEGGGPEDTALRNERNRAIRMARAQGSSQAEIDQLGRQYAMDLSSEQYKRETGALSDYQKLIGNILGGTSSLEMGFAGLEKSGEEVNIQSGGGSGMLGTVICTELYLGGYLSDEVYSKDIEYGIELRLNDPAVYIGYRILADPIVVAMKKSSLFTSIVAFFAVGWAKDMAGQSNITGKLVNLIGKPLCRFLGKIGESHAITERL